MEKVRRITAWITVIVIVGLIVATLVCAITGNDYFFGFLALTFLVPIVLWVFMWFTRLVHGKSEVIPENLGLNEKEDRFECGAQESENE